jgi:signal transduction protein with GAF and PtsI domain
MNLQVRLHDAVDQDTVLRRMLPVLAGARGERRATYAAYDETAHVLVHRWTAADDGEVEEARLELEPERLHALLADDAGGDRPLRPVDSAPQWVLKDLVPGIDPDKWWIRARAVSHDGRWLGVLVLAEPRRRMLARKADETMDAGGDVLELCLSRALMLRERQQAEEARAQAVRSLVADPGDRVRAAEAAAATARRDLESFRARVQALELAAERATGLLMEAHVDIDRRAQRHQRQTRVLYLLRKLLERSTQGMPPRELADEVVKTVSEAFGGSRCSLLLIDEHEGAPELRLCAAVGLPPMIDGDSVRIPLGRGISGAVASSRTALVVRDPDEGVTHPLMRDAWYTGPAFVSLPLLCRGQLLGVLNLSNFRAGTVDDYEVEQLRLIALCVGLLVDHAGLRGRLFAGQPA